MRKNTLVLMLGLAVAAGMARADLLVSYNTFGNAGTETTEPAVFTAANLTASNLTLVGVNPAANGNRFGGNNWSVSQTIDITNDYISLAITPSAGFQVSITEIVVFTDRSSTGPSNYTFRSSFDSFAADLFTIARTTTGILGSTNSVSGIVNATGSVELRLYGYRAGAGTGTGGIDIGSDTPNLLINGTVSIVPEPGTLALLGIGFATLTASRRKIRRSA